MLQMPNGTDLMREMKAALPLFCYSKMRNTKVLAAQGVRLSERTRLEVTDVLDMGEVGGLSCVIDHGGQPLVMSVTGFNFRDNGEIDKRITAYSKGRIEWVKQEERLDSMQGLKPRKKTVKQNDISNYSASPAKNSICPCGSSKKYKRCCGK
ncbi:MAG: SEC-C metal-binding domain-containing protein [Oscillospiraceae bacterium]|nr:SEC-C metal-binding domain-containing protein [Oscillospiraceae bacterium]